MEGWVVRITFGWSFFAVVRNDDKTLIWLLCCLFSTITRAYILRCRKVWKAQHFCLKFSNRFGIWQAARQQCYQVACQLSKPLEVFVQTEHSCLTAKNSSEIHQSQNGLLNVQEWFARSIYGSHLATGWTSLDSTGLYVNHKCTSCPMHNISEFISIAKRLSMWELLQYTKNHA